MFLLIQRERYPDYLYFSEVILQLLFKGEQKMLNKVDKHSGSSIIKFIVKPGREIGCKGRQAIFYVKRCMTSARIEFGNSWIYCSLFVLVISALDAGAPRRYGYSVCIGAIHLCSSRSYYKYFYVNCNM